MAKVSNRIAAWMVLEHKFMPSLAGLGGVDQDFVRNDLADHRVFSPLQVHGRQRRTPRVFIDGWVPASRVDGRIVKPGHQLEWAGLLERGARLHAHDGASEAARGLFALGISWGVRALRGAVSPQQLEGGSIHDDVARVWPQTERIKAVPILGDRIEMARSIDGLNLYFDMPVRGSWRDKRRPDGTFVEEPTPASSFYHIVCAIAELRPAPVLMV